MQPSCLLMCLKSCAESSTADFGLSHFWPYYLFNLLSCTWMNKRRKSAINAYTCLREYVISNCFVVSTFSWVILICISGLFIERRHRRYYTESYMIMLHVQIMNTWLLTMKHRSSSKSMLRNPHKKWFLIYSFHVEQICDIFMDC